MSFIAQRRRVERLLVERMHVDAELSHATCAFTRARRVLEQVARALRRERLGGRASTRRARAPWPRAAADATSASIRRARCRCRRRVPASPNRPQPRRRQRLVERHDVLDHGCAGPRAGARLRRRSRACRIRCGRDSRAHPPAPARATTSCTGKRNGRAPARRRVEASSRSSSVGPRYQSSCVAALDDHVAAQRRHRHEAAASGMPSGAAKRGTPRGCARKSPARSRPDPSC